MNNAPEAPEAKEPSPTPPSDIEGPTHRVLMNEEEQYSLWPHEKDIPAGWQSVFEGTEQQCLDHVESVWTDMRPKSVRS